MAIEAPPRRVTISTCIGCGAIRSGDVCADGCCVDRRLDLVRAADHAAVLAASGAARERATLLRPIAEELACAEPLRGEHAAALRVLRARARELLAVAGRDPSEDADVADAERLTTWWCPKCERVEAPQPCLGVCIYHCEDMVAADEHRRAVVEGRAWRQQAGQLTALARLAALLTPRDGRAASTWLALRRRALRFTLEHP